MPDLVNRSLLSAAATRAGNFLDSLKQRSVYPRAEAIDQLHCALAEDIPENSHDALETLEWLDRKASPAMVANAGGRYFGFVTGGALPATLAAHWLATAWDQNCFGTLSSPAVAHIENTAARWLKQALKLPLDAEAALVTGATMANFTCLAAARNKVLAEAGWDVEALGLFGAPEIQVIVGDQAHATLFKVLGMLGLGRNRVTRVPTDNQGRMMASGLPQIQAPAIVCLQAGNVNSGAFDPAGEIIDQASAAGAWVHVDGAFGIWARVSPQLAQLARDYERADSWATDAHKWLNAPYDCGVALVRHTDALRGAMSITGAYLLLDEQRQAIDVTPDSSRRARAVDVWAALYSLGRSGLAELVERNCAQARHMAAQLASAGAEILNDVVLNQVLVAYGSDERTHRVLQRIQSQGVLWCGGTRWRGREAIRISVSSWATTDEDIRQSVESIIRCSEIH